MKQHVFFNCKYNSFKTIMYQLWEIAANAVGKCSVHMSVEQNTVQND